MTKPLIRRATPGDAAAVLQLLQETYEATWKPELTADAIVRFEGSGHTLCYVNERICAMYIAESDGEIAGLVDWNNAFIDALHVSPRHQRHGIGSLLLQQAEAAIAAAGHAQVQLETDSFNHSARSFYLHHGYLETGFYPDEEWHSGFTTVQMTKRL